MAQKAAAGFMSRARALARGLSRHVRKAPALAACLLIGLGAPARAADVVRGEATFSAGGGFARLVIKLGEDVPSEVTTAGSILIIRFDRAVDVPVDRVPEGAPDYVNSARRDPDGSAIRLSLARRVTVNTMNAGERTFIDLLPEGWKGPPPSLPMDVVKELAERARVAERALRAQRAAAETKKRPQIRVRASVQPTFVRFVFEMPDGVGVSSVLNEQKLTLAFNAGLNFDLADAVVAAPPNVASIKQKSDIDQTSVEIALIGDSDVHSFRDEKNYVVDISFQPDKGKTAATAEAVIAQAKPVAQSHGPAPDKPAAEKPKEVHREIAPPTSETIAREARIEAKPEVKPEAPAAMPPVEAPKPAPAPTAEAPHAAEPPKDVSKPAAPATEAVVAPVKPAVSEAPKEVVKEAAKEPVKESVKAAPAEAPAAPQPTVASVDVRRDSDGLRVIFPLQVATPAAAFRRGDTVWLVFDTPKPIDVEAIRSRGGAMIGEVGRMPLDKGQAVRIRLTRPLVYSLTSEEVGKETNWLLTLADKIQATPLPLMMSRNITDPALANIAIPFANPGLLHKLTDPDAGDTLYVVTGQRPVRGFIKRQDLVDLSLLESAHGIAIRPNSDEVGVEVGSDKVILGKKGGLTLSPVDISAERAPTAVRPVFSPEGWRKGQSEDFWTRQGSLITAIAAVEPAQRSLPRLDLAQFYMSRAMYHEAKSVTDLMLADPLNKEESGALIMHAIANILIGRPAQGLKDLANPVIGNSHDSQLWKALAYARQGKWADAREKFKNVEFAIASLPIDIQRIVTIEAMRASLEVKDYAGASKRRSEIEVVGISPEAAPGFAVLRGRLAEALGHDKDALDDYKFAVASNDRQAAAEAKQLEVALRQKRDEISKEDALRELETLSMTWRGDSIEVKTLQMLSQMYAENGRYRDALRAARTATRLQPNAEASRQAQDLASDLFTQIFLGPKGDELPPVEALGMFYEFRELTPIGRRGDELIRRLADRLASIDLLDQAAELLQYQVDHRLEGAARAQVAARLSMIYLANRKPDMAISALRASRISDLSGELRQQRLLLEARAQSDVGRHDLALDIVSNVSGREVLRLRSDIFWAARRWRESAEQIELYYGDRFRDFKPLNAVEKSDIIRAAVGYALADDSIGLSRFREKYAPLMSESADRVAFDIASKPAASSSAEFAEIAKLAASVDTLDGFLREMKQRFPDATARAPASPQAKDEADHTGSLPTIPVVRQIKMTR
ncbi:tetratricopeptide repeat protein [Bradyrhizobium sp. 61]|uniref:tetratricopeptide repeat protein n=1 Tax=unclassified Bradyrhizobium TaxID=2631580 RepID=UPI001FFBB16D|nr:MULTISPECIES: tetratricopeptide repeat protein [unclassified Bradyrhizobium]MCK1274877.1 tetratricopeptide repeat protein [Bradyrhizobium sp. 61]MCK1274880.1 tetratricopeptide repeat protein [Bradyrhizobium sp. 61]MCK1444877.1 tetratricopeptide repeat protein [Bradyrhizobium sp. 48]MCK1459253.1 tetratricopeptide repeat protein [Bradyrhizobium sp. 2]